MNGVIEIFWGMGKKCQSLQVYKMKVRSKQAVPEVSIIHFCRRGDRRWVLSYSFVFLLVLSSFVFIFSSYVFSPFI